MRVELSREFPIPLKQGYDYLMDPKLFSAWRVGMIEILDPDHAAWSQAGDRFRFAYRLLGRRVEGECVLDELQEGELVRYTASIPGLPKVHETWRYRATGESSFELKSVQETEESTSFFGKAIDRMVFPRAIERDLKRTLDNLEDIFSMGVPD
ncbi:MAG: SRPBCC family protein [Acidimicrobiia bacterium]|nr:SRPBCC family protein [Acidimicrobiia bacterium]